MTRALNAVTDANGLAVTKVVTSPFASALVSVVGKGRHFLIWLKV